jgi:hypothetical protein
MSGLWRGGGGGSVELADKCAQLPHSTLVPPIEEGGGLPGLLRTFIFFEYSSTFIAHTRWGYYHPDEENIWGSGGT